MTKVAGRDLLGWWFVRELWIRSGDAEQKARLDNAWRASTGKHAADLLPEWYPAWPMWERHEPGDRTSLWDHDGKTAEALTRWREQNGHGPSTYDGCSGGCPPDPEGWWHFQPWRRDVTRHWAVRELARTGDSLTIRDRLFDLCEIEQADPGGTPALNVEDWNRPRTAIDQETGDVLGTSYSCALIYDTGILNRRYFDGERRQYTSPRVRR